MLRITENHKMMMVATALLFLLSQIPQPSYSPQNVAIESPRSTATEGYGHVSEIKYQWQEISGFCHWASSTMALRSAGVDMNLHELFAISGIGFSAAYVRYEDVMTILPGAGYRQMVPLDFISEIYGLNYSLYIDRHSDFAELYAQAMGIWGLDYTAFDGPNEALNLMRNSIDEGYPLVIATDLYYLPPKDYDIVRELGVTFDLSGAGHSVVVVGYNDTSQTAWIVDPGVGSFGEYFGYPSDGRWYYEVSYTNLSIAWSALGYLTVLVRPESNPVSDIQSRLIDFICDRLEGNRTSYAPSQEDLFFLIFGADAFRALSLDLNLQGLSLLLDEFDNHQSRVAAIWHLGYMTEFTCTLQYLSFRTALQELPGLFPSFDLTNAISIGTEALPHLAALSNNTTLICTNPSELGGSLVWDTIIGLSEEYNIQCDLETAIAPYLDNVTIIGDHLEVIADSWDSFAAALRQVLSGSALYPTILLVVGSASLFVIMVVVVIRRTR